MKLPIKQLRKKDLVWLSENKCKHGHSYLVHQNCYYLEQPKESPFHEKVGFFDIEAGNLKADFGYCFSYALKKLDGEILGRVLRPEEIRNFEFDKNLMRELVNDLKKFHRIVVHWGQDYRFDLPFIRSRCLKYNFDFPLYRDIFVHDTFSMAKSKLCLSRNRLENICDFLDIPSKGHKIIYDIWVRALAGDKDSLEYIWTHNKEDVISLEQTWKKLHPYVLRGKRSI